MRPRAFERARIIARVIVIAFAVSTPWSIRGDDAIVNARSCGEALATRWIARTHAAVMTTPTVDDVMRRGRGGVVAFGASARARALDGVSGTDAEGAESGWRAGDGRARGGVTRVGRRFVSATMDGEVVVRDWRGERARTRVRGREMRTGGREAGGGGGGGGGEATGGSTRALLGVDDVGGRGDVNVGEEARSDAAWDAVDARWRKRAKEAAARSRARRAVDGTVRVDPHVLSSPAVGDVDGDGALEIVFAVSYYFDEDVRFEDENIDPSEYAATGLVVLSGSDLSVKLEVALDDASTDASSARTYGSPTLADVDGDGRLDIVVGTFVGLLHVVRGDTGDALPGWPKRLGQIEGRVVAADVDSDGEKELVVCDARGIVTVFKANGIKLWEKDTTSRISIGASVGDIDGDGALEIVAGTASGAVHAFRAKDGTALSGWPVYVSDKILAPIVLTKFRPEKRGLDILVAAHNGELNVLDGLATCRDVVNVSEAIYAAPLVTSFANFGALDVVLSTMEGNIHAFTVKGSKFNALAVSSSDAYAASVDYFGIALQDRAYRIIRGTRMQVTYEIVDRRTLDVAKSKRTTHAPYDVTITLTSLDGFERTISAQHKHTGRFSIEIAVPATMTRGEIHASVVDATLNVAEDAYSVSFHENFEIALKWLVAAPFVLACINAIRRASADAVELSIFGASIPTSSKGRHEE